jgi:hypothetical protein
MEYGDIVWDNIPDNLRQSLESLQFEAIRIVTDATMLVGFNFFNSYIVYVDRWGL